MAKQAKLARPVKPVPAHMEDMRTKALRQAHGSTEVEFASVPRVAPNNHPTGTLESLAAILRTPIKKRDNSLLDDLIYKNGIAQVPMQEIARMVGLPVGEVDRRFWEMLEARNTHSPSEMRVLLTAQMKSLINAMYEAASAGSVEHAKILLGATERLAKIYELESQKATIEIQLVTSQQSDLIIRVLAHVLQRVMDSPEIAAHVPLEIVDAVAGEALGEAQKMIVAAEALRVVE